MQVSQVIVLIALMKHFRAVFGHAYLSYPYSRNAVGIVGNDICKWGGDIPCTGCPHCWNMEEPITGCGIVQGGGLPNVFGDGGLAFKNTGYKTSFKKGELVQMEITMSTWHGGHFEFFVQDVGNKDDPDGNKWQHLKPLTVDSFYPPCDEASQGCGADPCLQTKSCAIIPLQPYGIHGEKRGKTDANYLINVQLPSDLVCEHCVLQWHYLTGNSCPPDFIACEGSEEFWNCADLEITDDSGAASKAPVSQPTSKPPTSSPLAVVTNAPTSKDTRAPTKSPVIASYSGSPTGSPTKSPVKSEKSCISKINEKNWFYVLADAWCKVDCNLMVKKYSKRCKYGSRENSFLRG